MTRQGMTIGQLARAAGVGVETIRYYQRLGLLPQPGRAGGGYRRYGPAELTLLRYVRHARSLDLSLKEIAALKAQLGDGASFCAAVRAAVAAKRRRIDEQILALRKLRAELDGFLAACAARSEGAPCPTQVALMGGATGPGR